MQARTGRATKPDMITKTQATARPPESDWRRQWRDAYTDPRRLLEDLDLATLADRVPETPPDGFALRVPRAFVARMRRGDADDPLLRQVLPLDAEARIVPGYATDAVGDLDARRAPGVLHKYQGRALVVATGSCAVHCRYCFRRHYPYADDAASAGNWQSVIDYLASRPDVDELLLSGGDPWSLATHKLAALTARLGEVPHVRRLRIHTRLPVVLPARVDADLLAWIESLAMPVVVVLHANHAQEIDDAVRDAIADLRRSGAMLLNQAVLLRGVNDDVDAQAALSAALVDAGVLPYYLHQLDRVHGTAHFAVDDVRARAIVDAMEARLPGYMVPRLVREQAGATSKTRL
jgi:EF-P beta-lysylation protein EpmB